MMQNEKQVERIIEYLNGKIHNLKQRLTAYENPIMQEMAKNSPHLQMDYIRLSAELNANEDNLLAIQKFSQNDVSPAATEPVKEATSNEEKANATGKGSNKKK